MVKMVLKIDGMVCGMCESHINDAIRRNFQIKKVSSSHSKGQTEMIAEEPIAEEVLKKVIEETGYTLCSVYSEPYTKKKFFHWG